MRIIIEPTENNTKTKIEHLNPRIEMELQSDDLVFDEFADLFKRCAVAWGYHPNTVEEYFGNKE